MRKIRVVQTAPNRRFFWGRRRGTHRTLVDNHNVRKEKKKRNYSLILVDLHSDLPLIAQDWIQMHDTLSKQELEQGFSVRKARRNIRLLREAFPDDCLLRDVSYYYRHFACEHEGGYWLHGFIPLADYLYAVETSINLALSGKDFRHPFRDLNKRYPYEPSL
jgi:hypothetical protein